jgi:hypothetical protein
MAAENPPLPVPQLSMREIKKYGTPNQKLPQVDWQVTDDGKGLLTGTMKYWYDIATGKPLDPLVIAKLPVRGERHPFDERLVCRDVNTTVGSNDMGYCDANYVGLSIDPTEPEWSLSCPTEEDPIQTHPMFALQVGKEGSFGIVLEEAKAPTFQPKYDTKMVILGGKQNNEFEGFKVSKETIDKDLVGVESYKVTRQTLSMSFHTANQIVVQTFLGFVGKQFKEPAFAPSFLTSTEGRTWLLTSMSLSEFAGIYKIELEYTLSGMGSDGKGKSWNKLIYKDGANS